MSTYIRDCTKNNFLRFFMKRHKPKITIVVGTRPETIKMSPVIWECERRKQESADNFDYFMFHTRQHYFYNMDRVFFEQLGLP